MSGQPTDSLEDRIRMALARVRPADGASAALAGRVTAIPDASRRGAVWRRFVEGRAAAWAGAGALGALTVIGLAYVANRAIVFQGSGGPDATATPVPFDPTLEGPGILRDVAPVLPVALLVVGLLILVLGLRWALRWRWHGLVLRGTPVVLVALVPGWLAFQPGFVQGSSIGPALGYDVRVGAAPGSEGPDTWYSTVEPGGTTVAFITVRNGGPLSIRLEGVIEQNTGDTPLIPRFTAVWLAVDPHTFGFLSNVRPFEPTLVDPGEEVQLYLVGKAGACAYGPEFDLDAPFPGGTTRDRNLRLAYSVFGLTNESTVEMRMNLVEPYREGCTG